jgi:hypothetical protein
MVLFILAVGNKHAYKDYDTVEKHLQLTLTSLQQQTSNAYKVVVVCNEIPSFDLDGTMAEYHLVDFLPPLKDKIQIKSYESQDYNLFKIDKGCRLCSGLIYAQKYKPAHVFFLDCDDWVNVNLAQYLNTHLTTDLVCADKGIFVDYKSKTYKKRRGLVRYCGSTIAYKNTFLYRQFPELNNLQQQSNKLQIISELGESTVAEIFGNHVSWFELAKKGQLTYSTFPFFASCWVMGTGVNVSGNNEQSLGLNMDDLFLEPFGLPGSVELNESIDSIMMKFTHMMTYLKSMVEWKKSERKQMICYK